MASMVVRSLTHPTTALSLTTVIANSAVSDCCHCTAATFLDHIGAISQFLPAQQKVVLALSRPQT